MNEDKETIENQKPKRKNILGILIVVLGVILAAIPWIIVVVPGAPTGLHRNIASHEFEGAYLFQHGWPMVHATRLEIPETIEVKANGISSFKKNPLIPDNKSLDACLPYQYCTSGLRQALYVLPDPTLRRAYELANWSLIDTWKYWSGQSITRFHWVELAINLACFLLYLAIVATLLEIRRRNRANLKWYQISKLNFGLGASLIILTASLVSYEALHSKKIIALKAKMDEAGAFHNYAATQDEPYVSPRLTNLEPLFLKRLTMPLDFSWIQVPFVYHKFRQFVSKNFFIRITSLNCNAGNMSPELMNEVATYEHRSEFDHVDSLQVHLNSDFYGEDFLDVAPTKNIRVLSIIPFSFHRPISGKGKFANLERFSDLRVLDLNGYNFSKSQTGDLGNLLSVSISNQFLESEPDDWRWLEKATNLQRVRIDFNSFKVCAEVIPAGVHELDIFANGQKNPKLDLTVFDRFANLRSLTLSGRYAIVGEAKFQELKHLNTNYLNFGNYNGPNSPEAWDVFKQFQSEAD